MAKLIEEIILKVGVDTSKLNAALAGIGKKFDGLGKKIDGVTEETEENTAANKKALPTIKKNSLAIDDLDKKLDKSEDGWNSMTKSMVKYTAKAKKARGASSALSSALKTIAGIAAGGAALSIVTDRIADLNKASIDAGRLGVVATDLIALQEVGKSFGNTADDMTQGLKNISESVSEAFFDPKIEKARFFKEIGVDIAKIVNLSADKQFEITAKALAGMTDQARRQEIQLFLLSEEGFRLSIVMDELAKNGPAAKAAIQDLVPDDVQIEKMRELTKQVTRMKTQLGERFIPAVGLAADGIELLFDGIDVWADFMVNADFVQRKLTDAIEDYAFAQRQAVLDEKLRIKSLKEVIKAEKKAADESRAILSTKEARQKIHTEKLAELSARLDAQGPGAGTIKADKIFKANQARTRALLEEENAKVLAFRKIRDKDDADKIKKIKAAEMAVKKIREAESLSRKKDLISRLRQSGQASLNFAGEAGSVQAQILQSEVQGRNSGKLSLADKLDAEVKAEEKANNEKQLKLAEDQVELLKKIEKKTSKNNNKVRGI